MLQHPYLIEPLMELDPITKWLVRVASVIIILAGLILAIAIPVVALTISSKITAAQDSIKGTIELVVQNLLT